MAGFFAGGGGGGHGWIKSAQGRRTLISTILSLSISLSLSLSLSISLSLRELCMVETTFSSVKFESPRRRKELGIEGSFKVIKYIYNLYLDFQQGPPCRLGAW